MLTYLNRPTYADSAPAKSGADLGGSNSKRRTAPKTGAIFLPVCYGGCARDAFGHAGFTFWTGPPTCVQSPPSWFLGGNRGATPKPKGVSPMAKRRILTLSPSKSRAKAHRAMARAALFSDSSAAVRLRRYNHHMSKARALEAAASGQECAS